MASKYIALDFDGVLSRPATGYKMGELMPGAIEAVTELIEMGYKPICYTVRANSLAGTKAVINWLKYFKFPPMAVVANKPNAVLYIDDRAYRFGGWATAMQHIRNGLLLDNAGS